MTSPVASPVQERLQRACRVVSGLLLLAAVIVWLTPVNVPGANLQPYDCGTPAAASPGSLSRLVCSETMRQARGVVLALVIASVLVLLLGEIGSRIGMPSRGPWLFATLALVVPVVVVAVTSLFLPVLAHGADGTKFSCGTPMSPVTDPFYKGLCAALPGHRKAWAFGAIALALALLAGVAYVESAGRRAVAHDAETDSVVPEPAGTDPALTEPAVVSEKAVIGENAVRPSDDATTNGIPASEDPPPTRADRAGRRQRS